MSAVELLISAGAAVDAKDEVRGGCRQISNLFLFSDFLKPPKTLNPNPFLLSLP
jgi:hypothetical protein